MSSSASSGGSGAGGVGGVGGVGGGGVGSSHGGSGGSSGGFGLIRALSLRPMKMLMVVLSLAGVLLMIGMAVGSIQLVSKPNVSAYSYAISPQQPTNGAQFQDPLQQQAALQQQYALLQQQQQQLADQAASVFSPAANGAPAFALRGQQQAPLPQQQAPLPQQAAVGGWFPAPAVPATGSAEDASVQPPQTPTAVDTPPNPAAFVASGGPMNPEVTAMDVSSPSAPSTSSSSTAGAVVAAPAAPLPTEGRRSIPAHDGNGHNRPDLHDPNAGMPAKPSGAVIGGGPVYVTDQPSSNDRTSAERFNYNGVNAIVGYNICLKKRTVTVYAPGDAEGNKVAARLGFQQNNSPYSGFKYGDIGNIRLDKSKIPAGATRKKGTYILVNPPWGNHIGHAWDVYSFLWQAHMHPDRHPWLDGPVDGAVFFNSHDGEYLYLQELRKLISKPFHTASGSQTPVVLSPDVNRDQSSGGGVVCYERAVFAGMATSGIPYQVGAIFSSIHDATLWREFAYKELGVPEPDRSRNSKVRAFIIDRCPSTRCISNHQEVVNYMKKDTTLSKFIDWDWIKKYQPDSPGKMSKESLKQQVTIMRETDILIGVHGSGLVNAVFMETGSYVFELLHPGLFEPIFNAGSEASGHVHRGFPTRTPDQKCRSMLLKCAGKSLIDKWHDATCRQTFKGCNVHLGKDDLEIFAAALLEAAQHVVSNKRPPSPDGWTFSS